MNSAVAGDGHAPIDSTGGVARQAFRARPFEVPDLTAIAGIERHALVGRRDVHDAADYDGRHFEPRAAGQRKDPRRRQRGEVCASDAIERAEPIAARLTVIRRPVGVAR